MITKSYGYKICYKDLQGNSYHCHFMTYSLRHAKYILKIYTKDSPLCRSTNLILKNATWKIIPISKDEVLAGIWREDPF